jgi:hypothetical protein
MNVNETNTLLAIDRQIAILQKRKEQILKAKPLSEMVKYKRYIWVINNGIGRYYQFVCIDGDKVRLGRFGQTFSLDKNDFDNSFRIATEDEIKQHLRYLKSKDLFFIDEQLAHLEKMNEQLSTPKKHMIDPTKCDFYMVTVTGEFGSKVRHDNYDKAIKEATRLAKVQNHKAWVTGVVAIVEPIKQEVQVRVITK